MTKRNSNLTWLAAFTWMVFSLCPLLLSAQGQGVKVSGLVTESGTGLPIKQVSVSVAATGTTAITAEDGTFTITVPDLQSELIVYIPGFVRRNIFLTGNDQLNVALVSENYRSFDDIYNSPFGELVLKDAVYATSSVYAQDVKLSQATSFDQLLAGRVPGLRAVRQSGMPGQRTYMNIRGASSLYAHSEPLLFIDGMLHHYDYAQVSLMEGFALNPMDVVDIDDITDITVQKAGLSHLGASASPGIIYVNTEQKAETSTIIRFSSYGGISTAPASQSVLDASQYKSFFQEMLGTQGYSQNQVDAMYPWLNGGTGTRDYYKYNNNTDWQSQTYSPSAVTKHHFFLKGGDEIATYNLSTGYQRHNGIYDNSFYNRFNLRVNGTVNITSRFTITPNVKLAIADSKIANHGPSEWKNPLLSTILIPENMGPNARDAATGTQLDYLDDTGVFNVSNPSAIVENAQGINRNYHFLSSATAQYRFNDKLSIRTIMGINYNNVRENIFLPDIGIIEVDSAFNSPGDFIYEFRSTQNHTTLSYKNKTAAGHAFNFDGGLRYMENSYKHNLSLDLNTPSDEFRRLGQGAQYSYLRSTVGDNRGLGWISYFGSFNYGFRNRYFLSANLSYDGTSATNEANRYHFFPSVGAAWRLSSEKFLSEANWLEDMKLRASYSITGNMFSSVYDHSKRYYTTRRMNASGVLFREGIPNENLGLEKRSTMNAGLDLSLFSQLLNMHVDVYQSNVDNLIIQQSLPATFGYTTYYDNGGALKSSGVEFSMNSRLQRNQFVWTFGGAITKESTTIQSLNFLNPNSRFIVTPVGEMEYITSVGNPINAFYGFSTNGLITAAEAGQYIGPKGIPLKEGDVRFVDVNGDKIIDDADKMIIGDPNPDFFGYLFTGFAYKRFELSAFLNYSVGNDIYNYVRYRAEAMDSYNNQFSSTLQRWTPSNTNTTMPRANFGDPAGNASFSDRWIEDGSFLRLQQLTLSYKIPQVSGIFNNGVLIYMTATNVLTLTKYSGYDPEFMYLNSPFYMGIDYGKIPHTSSFILGVKLDL